MKKKKLLLLPVILVLLLLAVVCAEERKSYEILHSTVMSAPNLTEHKITVVIHTLLPVDREALVKEIVTNHQRLNGAGPILITNWNSTGPGCITAGGSCTTPYYATETARL